ncbi:MAG: type II toxin-antitoxin system PemK/MazF family toxin [Calditrichaeota bacterium]|nr:MAG: type II toxin-antitoxin system PemK/MazF family toxin [Calditrichota bacterium]
MNLYSRGDVILVGLNSDVSPKAANPIVRPAVVVSSDTLNSNLNTIIVCPIIEANGVSESRIGATFVHSDIMGLGKNCIVLSFQIRSIDKNRVTRRVGSLPEIYLKQVQEGLIAALEIE